MESKHDPRIYELLNEFFAYIGHRLAKNTVIGYKLTLRQLWKTIPSRYEDLSPQQIEHFLQGLRLSPNSVNTYLNAIKSFCRYCEEQHDLPNPARKVKYLNREPWKQRVLSPEELQKVLAVCNDKNSGLAFMLSPILFLANTGLRITELFSLSQDSISPDGRLLYIVGKGRKPRTVPLNNTAKNEFPNIMSFLKYPPSKTMLWKHCQKIARIADIPGFGAHALRHYYATELSKSVPIYLLSKLLGHASVTITEQIYIHLHDTDFVGLTDVLDSQKL